MFASKFGVVFRNMGKISGQSKSIVLLRNLVDTPINATTPNPPKFEEDSERLFKQTTGTHEKLEKKKSRKAKKGMNCRSIDDPCKKKFEDKSRKDNSCPPVYKDDLPKAKFETLKAKECNQLKDDPNKTKVNTNILVEDKKEQMDEYTFKGVGNSESSRPSPAENNCKKKGDGDIKQDAAKSIKDSLESKPTNICEKTPKKRTGKEQRMKALLYKTSDKEVALKEVDIPTSIKKDEVMIKVRYAGMNSTDFSILEGVIPTSKDQFIPGREFSGIVCGCGEQVEHVKAGDNVAVSPCIPGTLCRFCADEKCTSCLKEGGSEKALGLDRDGGWAEYSVVPGNIVYKVPEGTNELSATLLPTLAQVMCVMSKLQVNQGMQIALLGGSLPTSLIALALQNNGFDNVIICEDNPNKVKQLEALCTGYQIISPCKLPGMELDMVLTNGAGSSAMQKAMASLKVQGQFIIIGPIGGSNLVAEVKIPASDLSKKQIRIFGMMGTPSNPTNLPPAIVAATLSVEKLGIETFTFNNFKEALTRIQTGDISYALLQIKADC